MKINLRHCMLVFAGIFISGSALAAPCEINKSKFGVWIGDCLVENLFAETIELRRVENPTLALLLPDLYPDDADFYTVGTTVEVEVRTGNQGQAPSSDYDVTAEVTISGNGIAPQTVVISNRAPGIGVGQRQTTVLGTVQLPDRIYDYDLHTVIYADTGNMTSGGEIWELNETNNRFDDGICRVYGENPDLSVQACR